MAIFTFPLYTPPIAIRSLPASRLELFFYRRPLVSAAEGEVAVLAFSSVVSSRHRYV